jgi:hypothetical protein
MAMTKLDHNEENQVSADSTQASDVIDGVSVVSVSS